MDNLYLFKKEEYLPRKKIAMFTLEHIAWVLLSLIISLVFFYFDEVLLGYVSLLFFTFSLIWLCKTFLVRHEKYYTVQLQPGGITFLDDQERLRFIPIEKIRKIKQLSMRNMGEDRSENINIWLFIYSIKLRNERHIQEIRFKEYRKEGRDIKLKFGEGMSERSDKFLEQVKSLDRSEEFMNHIGLTLDENEIQI